MPNETETETGGHQRQCELWARMASDLVGVAEDAGFEPARA